MLRLFVYTMALCWASNSFEMSIFTDSRIPDCHNRLEDIMTANMPMIAHRSFYRDAINLIGERGCLLMLSHAITALNDPLLSQRGTIGFLKYIMEQLANVHRVRLVLGAQLWNPTVEDRLMTMSANRWCLLKRLHDIAAIRSRQSAEERQAAIGRIDRRDLYEYIMLL